MQNGTSANSGAIFMAVSYEMPAAQNHNIADDGESLQQHVDEENVAYACAFSPGSHDPTLSLLQGFQLVVHSMARSVLIYTLLFTHRRLQLWT